MILSMYIAMYGVAIWVLYFAERVSLAVGIIGMITACVCMAIANFKYQRMLDQLETLECELRTIASHFIEHSVTCSDRIGNIERKMDDDGK